MHIISRKTLKEFWTQHSDSEQALLTWFSITSQAKWESPNDIKEIFRSADFLPNDRVCFNIKGNRYRLVVKIQYKFSRVYIRFIGTHSEYDKINAVTI
ncbi:type II toxin-antitoxin system HigB family toxin [bacterium]|nr:type II toxin-antitoxin system HigB family toxin [bacterium]